MLCQKCFGLAEVKSEGGGQWATNYYWCAVCKRGIDPFDAEKALGFLVCTIEENERILGRMDVTEVISRFSMECHKEELVREYHDLWGHIILAMIGGV